MLNWDLRPVTVYDFVRAFCALLVPGARSKSSAAAAAAAGTPLSQPQPRPSVGVTLQAKENKEKELERLRIGAEDVADLASFGAFFFLLTSGSLFAFLSFISPLFALVVVPCFACLSSDAAFLLCLVSCLLSGF